MRMKTDQSSAICTSILNPNNNNKTSSGFYQKLYKRRFTLIFRDIQKLLRPHFTNTKRYPKTDTSYSISRFRPNRAIFRLAHLIFLSILAICFPLAINAKHSVPMPYLVPIRYDLQIQLPTASEKDPLIPTFFGALKLEFQLTRPISASTYYDRYRGRNVTDIPPSKYSQLSGIELKLKAENLDVFENVTLKGANSNKKLPIADIRREKDEVIFFILESVLTIGRYILKIDRYQGLITYDKGVYYRDAGGVPVLGTDLFTDHTRALFPHLGGPLTKTTIRLIVIHPKDTIALSNMQLMEPIKVLNDNWKISKFVQAPNLAAYLVSIAVLPTEIYDKIILTGHLPMYIWTNKIVHKPTLKQEIANLAGPVFSELFGLLNEPLPLTNLDLLIMNDFNGTHSFGLITLSYEEWEASDEAHRIAILARNFGRQWIGGMTTISTMAHFCFQEDVIEYLVNKVVRKLVKSPKKLEQYFLANYIRLQLAETFLAPGESVAMKENADAYHIETHCGLKGTQALESLEGIGDGNEEVILAKIRHILKNQRYKSFSLENFLELLRGQIVDNIDLAQVYEFWFKSGGIPNILVQKKGERLRLTQLNKGRQSQINAGDWAQMPLWPLRISLRNISLPLTFMLSQALEMAPLDKKLIALTNVNYENVYRVNYDTMAWEGILKNLPTTFNVITARSRAQLLNDFCYFSAVGQVGAEGEVLRKGFLQLLREHYEQFEMCDLYMFWCVGGFQKKINMDKAATRRYWQLIKGRVWPALWNHKNYECGGPGAVSDSANELCQLVFGRNCLSA